MTTETNTFSFAGLELRSVTIEGKPWFVATDVIRLLGNDPKRTGMFLRALGENEIRPITPKTFEGKGMSLAKLITESGLYKLVMRAQKANPKAAEFQTWVTGTVLPAIRQDGMYVQGEEKLDPNNDAWTGSTNLLSPLRKVTMETNSGHH